MDSYDRPLFVGVGRPGFRPGETRSRLVLLGIATGLVAAGLALVWELRELRRMTVVKVWLDLPAEEAPAPPTAAPPP